MFGEFSRTQLLVGWESEAEAQRSVPAAICFYQDCWIVLHHTALSSAWWICHPSGLNCSFCVFKTFKVLPTCHSCHMSSFQCSKRCSDAITWNINNKALPEAQSSHKMGRNHGRTAGKTADIGYYSWWVNSQHCNHTVRVIYQIWEASSRVLPLQPVFPDDQIHHPIFLFFFSFIPKGYNQSYL